MSNSTPDHPDSTGHRVSAWSTALPHLASALVICGLVTFASLACVYDIYYRQFGITPTDVGMGYTDTLLHSWGFILALSMLLIVAYVVVKSRWLTAKVLGEVNGHNIPGKTPMWVGLVIYVVIAGFLSLFSATQVGEAARRAANGQSVTPLRLGPLMMFDVYAHPVTRIATASGADVKSISTKNLMYLGNADRSFVLYQGKDEKEKHIIKISMERFVLFTSP